MTVFLGIDVGTGSARAGLFDDTGALLAHAAFPIAIHHGRDGIVEHESADIWSAVCKAANSAREQAGAVEVGGIGVDAACSMVVEGQQLSAEGTPSRDVIVWMDHRATAEADEINSGQHMVLDYVGGRISPEMQTPKLLWLIRHRPDAFLAASHFMDLADWLTYRMTGSLTRSGCTLTCKWTYLGHERRFDDEYFRSIGLGGLVDEGFARIGRSVAQPGTQIGTLQPAAAEAMGLPSGIPVAAGLIDAHSGGIGTLGAPNGPGEPLTRMAYVFGTSACTMTTSRNSVRVAGVWGPYYDAMLPGYWLNEGGQSAAGAGLDQLVRMHPAYRDLGVCDGAALDLLTDLALKRGLDHALARASRYTVVPDFNGNRAPLADPHARAIIAGLGTERDTDSLVDLFVAGLVGLGHGLRHIIEAQRAEGLNTEAIVISGGAGANTLARQVLTETTRLPVLVPATQEPVLLGAAMLGAVVSRRFETLEAAMAQMSAVAETIEPGEQEPSWLDASFARYCALQSAAGNRS